MDYLTLRIWVAIMVILTAMGVLLARLWQLQLIHGESYVEMSRQNRVRVIRRPPARGRILDCNGVVLATNQPSFIFSVVPAELENPQEVIETSSTVLGIPQEKMRALIERSRSIPRFMSYPIKKNMTLEEVSLVKAHAADLKGAMVEVRPVRVYPRGENLCHVIGTLGEISAEELAKSTKMGYRVGDLLGKSGIEKEYETHLRGEEGWGQIEIDAKGRQLANLGTKPPRTGADIVLTIDADLQRYIEDNFVERAGAVVAVEPDTGRVLAMVSKPEFDPNLFSPSITERQWKILNDDAFHPLENRAIRGLYAPASTFKIVTAAAALTEKAITPSHKFTCTGQLEIGGLVFRCWNPYGHGKVDLRKAIVESCDSYFYETGLRVGVDRIAHYASLFGLGNPTGISLPDELPGLIPTAAWKLRTYGQSWKDGETFNLAIGQGYLLSTPLQLAMMVAAVANGGKLLRPAIVRQIRSAEGEIKYEHQPVERGAIPLSSKDLKLLRDALTGVVSDTKGTGKRARIPGFKIGGKTGTSQVVKQGAREAEQIPYHERTHAMFVAYVDDRPKKIALVVVIEHGGGGGANAAPLARKIICRYYGVHDTEDTDQ